MRYWVNGSGYYDPVVATVIEKETRTEKAMCKAREHAREKQVHDTVMEIKNILKSRGMELGERVVIKDRETGKIHK